MHAFANRVKLLTKCPKALVAIHLAFKMFLSEGMAFSICGPHSCHMAQMKTQ